MKITKHKMSKSRNSEIIDANVQFTWQGTKRELRNIQKLRNRYRKETEILWISKKPFIQDGIVYDNQTAMIMLFSN